MNKCKYWIFIALLLTTFQASAQGTKRNPLEQRKFQVGIQGGTLNYGVNAAFKLSEKLNLYLETGRALVYIFSEGNYYNKFNKNYAEYNDLGGGFLNFGEIYWAAYSEASIRYLFMQKSRIKYKSTPYANTFGYLAGRLRINSSQTNSSYSGKVEDEFRETYLLSALAGMKVELDRTSFTFIDLSLGLSLVSNYKIAAFTPGVQISMKFGFNLWSTK